MKIEQFTVKDLREGLANRVWSEERFAIPEERAIAQINNPRAIDSDVVLFVGYEEDKVIGSLGVIPDFLFANGEKTKFGWLNNWNGAADKSHAGIGALLFLGAASAYRNSIGVSGFTEAARRVYEGSKKFVTLKEKHGVSFYIRSNSAEIVTLRFPKLLSLGPLFKIADKLLNQLVNFRLSRWQARHCRREEFSVTYLDGIDGETDAFIKRVRSQELFMRGADELNWMKEYRWNGESAARILFIKILDAANEMVGFVFLKAHRGTLTVPYYFCEDRHFDFVLKTIGQQLIELGAYDLLVYDSSISDGLRRLKFPSIHERSREKQFLISKLYRDLNLSTYNVHDGDGDAFI